MRESVFKRGEMGERARIGLKAFTMFSIEWMHAMKQTNKQTKTLFGLYMGRFQKETKKTTLVSFAGLFLPICIANKCSGLRDGN